MAVHRKLDILVDRLRPDVAVIAECGAPEVLARRLQSDPPYSSLSWTGRTPTKGLAVVTFGDYRGHHAFPEDLGLLEWAAPVAIQGPISFNLLAIWAMNQRASNTKSTTPVPQPVAALARYEDWVAARPTIMAGDFNHNVLWDRPRSPRNHSATVEAAAQAGLTSSYHSWFGEAFGAESHPTLYWRQRTENGPHYHVDYVFSHSSFVVRNFSMGTFADWVAPGLSDHVPLAIDLDLP